MIELLFLLIFFLSLLGIFSVVYRKIPVLVQTSVSENSALVERVKNNLKEKKHLSINHIEILLQKVLSKIRIITLKTEKKINDWLNKLRQRSIKKNKDLSDDYWDKLRK